MHSYDKTTVHLWPLYSQPVLAGTPR